MRPIGTDRPARRLVAAVLAAALFHALLFVILAALASPSGGRGSGAGNGDGSATGQAARGFPEKAGGTVSIPVLIGSQDEGIPAVPAEIPELPETAIPENPVPTPGTDPVQRSAGSGSNGTESGTSAVGGSGSGDGSASGEGTGSGEGSGIAARRAFLGWLDDAIKARLSYPERARIRNLEGTVVIALSVPADGSACEVTVAGTSGSATLDRAAIALVHSLFPAPLAPGSAFSTRFSIRYALSGQ